MARRCCPHCRVRNKFDSEQKDLRKHQSAAPSRRHVGLDSRGPSTELLLPGHLLPPDHRPTTRMLAVTPDSRWVSASKGCEQMDAQAFLLKSHENWCKAKSNRHRMDVREGEELRMRSRFCPPPRGRVRAAGGRPDPACGQTQGSWAPSRGMALPRMPRPGLTCTNGQGPTPAPTERCACASGQMVGVSARSGQMPSSPGPRWLTPTVPTRDLERISWSQRTRV